MNVNQQAVAVAQKLYDDNKKQVEIGTLAPIEVVRAEAQLATAQQALVAAQSAVLQLEAVLKSALSRNGLTSPAILEAHVIPTDPIRIPETEAIQPVQDLVSRALDSRPDVAAKPNPVGQRAISCLAARAMRCCRRSARSAISAVTRWWGRRTPSSGRPAPQPGLYKTRPSPIRFSWEATVVSWRSYLAAIFRPTPSA